MTRRATFILTILLSLTAVSVPAQTFKRNKNEITERFIKRITHTDNEETSDNFYLAYEIVETKEWDSTKTILLAFIHTPDEIVIGQMFVPIDSFTYRQVLVDSFATLGNTAEITGVFFLNVDADKTRELIVMTTYDQGQKGNTIKKIYWNLIFDNPTLSVLPKKLKYLRSESKIIDGSKFKNPSDIKARLTYFDKEQPFEIISSKRGITKQSSAKDTNMCQGWGIPQALIPTIVKDCKEISGEDWHHLFSVLPCTVTGQLSQNGQIYKFEINGGSWIYIFCKEKTILLGNFKTENEKYFIDKAWNGKE